MKRSLLLLAPLLFAACDRSPTGQGNISTTDTVLEPDALLREEMLPDTVLLEGEPTELPR